ncbi:MAG: CRISPR system precrRNA processing endoribonuclease RAMP protein Cas6 [Desulfobia sp.]
MGRYHFTCSFTDQALLPPFKGSAIRGKLGHCLKKISCALRARQSCKDCLLHSSCCYALFFEPRKVAGDQRSRTAAWPQPYVLEGDPESNRFYVPGQEFTFSLLVFGRRMNELLPHLVYAVETMGWEGLCSRREYPGTFELQTISSDQECIYDHKKILNGRDRVFPHDLAPSPASRPERLLVRLLTPLRVKADNRFQDNLSFQLLVRAALRRISLLEEAYGHGEPSLDYPGLLEKAGEVEIRAADYGWQEVERYSSRQQSKMSLGGMVGEVEYKGDLQEFYPLLKYCETTHLGKQTSFGLGRIEVEAA